VGREGSIPCGEILGADFTATLAESPQPHFESSRPSARPMPSKAAGLAGWLPAHTISRLERALPARRPRWIRCGREASPACSISSLHAFGTPGWKRWGGGPPEQKPVWTFKAQEAAVSEPWKQVVKHERWWTTAIATACVATNRCHHRGNGRAPRACSPAPARWPPSQGRSGSSAASPFRKERSGGPGLPRLRLPTICQANRTKTTTVASEITLRPRLTQKWLVEIPTEVSWANIPGARGLPGGGRSTTSSALGPSSDFLHASCRTH